MCVWLPSSDSRVGPVILGPAETTMPLVYYYLRVSPTLASQWCNGLVYNALRYKLDTLHMLLALNNHTPYMVCVDHSASIQVRVIVNSVDYCFAIFGMCNSSSHG